MNATQPRQIGQVLITKGILSEDQLRIALLEQMKTNQPVGKLLVTLGFVTEATLRDALSESLENKASIFPTPSSTRRRLRWCPANWRSATSCCPSTTTRSTSA